MTKRLPPLCRTAAKLYIGPPNRAGGFPLTQGMLEAIEAVRGSSLYGETFEDTVGYLLRDALMARETRRRS